MRRRALLTTVAGVAVAGCTSGPRTPGDTTTRTDTPEPVPAEAVVRHPAVRYYRNDDAIGADRASREQFAYVRVEDGGTASVEDFALRLDGTTYDPFRPPGFSLSVPGVGERYRHGAGWLLFDVPAADPDGAALVVDGRERPLAPGTLSSFGTTATLRVERVNIPDSVTAGEDVVVSAAVTNEGDREGTFLGGVQRGGQPQSVTETVPVGETVSVTGRVPTYEDESEVRVVFVRPGDDRSHVVTVDSGATPTATE